MKISIFGDSIAKGVIFNEDKNRYTFLKNCFFSITESALGVPMKNYAKFGCTVDKGTEIINKHHDEISESDFTILEFGGNDCDFNWAEIAENPQADHTCQVPIDSFKSKYKSVIQGVFDLGTNPILMTLPPLCSRRFFDWISRGLDKDNIMKFLNDDIFSIYRWHEEYNTKVLELAEEFKLPYIDIRSIFTDMDCYEDYICIDGMHPNEKGHELISQEVITQLETIIRCRKCSVNCA